MIADEPYCRWGAIVPGKKARSNQHRSGGIGSDPKGVPAKKRPDRSMVCKSAHTDSGWPTRLQNKIQVVDEHPGQVVAAVLLVVHPRRLHDMARVA